MAMISFSCKCGVQFHVDASNSGRRMRCGRCQAVLTVPSNPATTVYPVANATVSYPCPHCDIKLEANAVHIGQVVRCGACGELTVVPARSKVAPALVKRRHRDDDEDDDNEEDVDLSGITTPILISAIANLIIGIFWACTVFGFIFAIPMWICCAAEFGLHGKADRLPAEKFAKKANNLATFEIIVGLLNLFSLVCGILVLINSGKVLKGYR